jgi:hypothetical protein
MLFTGSGVRGSEALRPPPGLVVGKVEGCGETGSSSVDSRAVANGDSADESPSRDVAWGGGGGGFGPFTARLSDRTTPEIPLASGLGAPPRSDSAGSTWRVGEMSAPQEEQNLAPGRFCPPHL